MEKIDIGTNIFIYPMPVTLLGTKIDEKANFMALGWLTRVNANPPLLAAGVNKTHFTNELIRKNKTFSINFPSAEMIQKTDYCGLNSGKIVDKSEIFQVYYGELETAPLIEECPLSLECKLVDIYEMPANDLFIGEITASYTEKKYLTN
ncbi:MAG: flavin reductase family protein, partial [Methanobacteriaceae archaeon]|nr:flavin reductase family protein [Methanobacteriaceae archaeon]